MPSFLLANLWPVRTLPVYDATPAISTSTYILNPCIYIYIYFCVVKYGDAWRNYCFAKV